MTASAVTGIWHIGLHVADLERSIAFYRDQLGLTLIHRQEQSNEYTRRLVGYPDAVLRVAQLAVASRPDGAASSHDLELIEYVVPRGERSTAERCQPGTAHLAFVVADIRPVHERLVAAGVEFTSAPNAITAGVNAGGFCCYFSDPDGHTLELVQPPVRDPRPDRPDEAVPAPLSA